MNIMAKWLVGESGEVQLRGKNNYLRKMQNGSTHGTSSMPKVQRPENHMKLTWLETTWHVNNLMEKYIYKLNLAY